MSDCGNFNLALMSNAASEASAVLRVLANEDRLLLLCQLSQGEKSVGELETLLKLPSTVTVSAVGRTPCRRAGHHTP